MTMLRLRFALVLLFATGFAQFACGGASSTGAAPASQDVDLPGIDTRTFTPRERHEVSQYAMELPSPCADVAVPVGQCVIQKRPCPACLPALGLIGQAVRNGLALEQVEDLYKERFDRSAAQDIPVDGSPSRGPES